MNPSMVERIISSFSKKDDVFTCKLCSKMLYIDSDGSGSLTKEQKQFLILAKHSEKDCKCRQ